MSKIIRQKIQPKPICESNLWNNVEFFLFFTLGMTPYLLAATNVHHLNIMNLRFGFIQCTLLNMHNLSQRWEGLTYLLLLSFFKMTLRQYMCLLWNTRKVSTEPDATLNRHLYLRNNFKISNWKKKKRFSLSLCFDLTSTELWLSFSVDISTSFNFWIMVFLLLQKKRCSNVI